MSIADTSRSVKTEVLTLKLDIVCRRCGSRIAWTRPSEHDPDAYSVQAQWTDGRGVPPGEGRPIRIEGRPVGERLSIERAMATRYVFECHGKSRDSECRRRDGRFDIRLARRRLEAALKAGERRLMI